MPDSLTAQNYEVTTNQETTIEPVLSRQIDSPLPVRTPNNSLENISSSSTSNNSTHSSNDSINDVVPQQASPSSDSKPDLAPTTTNISTVEPIYSVFTPGQKRFIVFMASWASFFSPVSGQIYFPALPALARDLNVSNTLINLTLVSYMLAQGAAPTLIGDLADNTGRRLAYIVCFVIYILANIGLALQNSYAALFVLRIFQSAGSSGTIALASAVVSDVATASERGRYMGYTSAGSLIGPAIGPVLGGVLTKTLGWRAIFWFLLILGATFLIIFGGFFPETARSQVGDGSIPPKSYNMSLMNYLAVRKARLQPLKDGDTLSRTPTTITLPPTRRLRFPNPLSSLHIIWDPENALLLLYNAFLFAAFYDVTAVIPTQFELIYAFNSLQIGLCYIPFGLGSLAAALLNGHLLDRNFARWCRKLHIPIKKGRQTDLRGFPIEKARLQIALPATYAAIALTLAFGWTLHFSGPLPLILVILFFTALAMSISFNVTSTLLVDFYPRTPATAVAANNLVRCWFGAGMTAAVIPMVESWGRGWTFTAVCAFMLVMSPMLWVVYFRGQGWRERRRRREEKVEEERDRRSGGREEEGGVGGEGGGVHVVDVNVGVGVDVNEKDEKRSRGWKQDDGAERQAQGQWHSSGLHRIVSHHSTC